MATLQTSHDAREGFATRRHSVVGSIGRNTLFGIFASVVQVATRLVTVPVVIAHLGLGGFGIWSIIMTTAAYMRFGSVGIRSAFQKYVAEATGNGDYERASKLLSTGTVAMVALSAVALIPISVFSKKLARLSGVPPEFLSSAAWAIATLGLVMILSNAAVAYESTIMGGHRIDLTRKLSTVTCVLEAAGIVTVLHLGYGLFAMAVVMALSEVTYGTYCYLTARRVLPEIHIRLTNVTKSVAAELFRFAGSYQLLSVLQMTYSAIAPIAILRAYGANPAGVYAVANRLVSPVLMCEYAFLLPLLSGGAMVYASGSAERMRALVAKSFKVTLALTLLPLTLISAFGGRIVFAWTGQADPVFQTTLMLVSLGVLFQAFALVGLVFYRTSGKAVMDNVREVLRIGVVILVVAFARQLGFLGVLLGLGFAEMVGMLFMLLTLGKTIHVFETKRLLADVFRFAVSTVGIVVIAILAAHVPVPVAMAARTEALIRVVVGCVAAGVVGYPFLYLTGAVSASEVRSAIDTLKGQSDKKESTYEYESA